MEIARLLFSAAAGGAVGGAAVGPDGVTSTNGAGFLPAGGLGGGLALAVGPVHSFRVQSGKDT